MESRENNTKNHYDNYLGNFYSWSAGDFISGKEKFISLFKNHKITGSTGDLKEIAIDVGAGHGIHSSALAELGYEVLAIDFNQQLLNELKVNTAGQDVKTIYDDIKNLKHYATQNPALIICMGDTITHFETLNEIEKILEDSFDILINGGKFITSFRDYSIELKNNDRFIPVKSDENRILLCFLEFFKDKVKVNDLFYEKQNGNWKFNVSSYCKYRLSENRMSEILKNTGFKILDKFIDNGMIYFICEK
ncbi:MAG TPA: class I SAM-dependent methyltransferase [Ignavibacteria bacterium]|nr:class I SAM-dependent methyltransferase [Ignavibacteria bacterium]